MALVDVDRNKVSTGSCRFDDGDLARAFYSKDFDWEALRAEIEDSSFEDCGTAESLCPLGVDQMEGPDERSAIFSTSAWEEFHKNHSKALFFKERRYLLKEFPELLSSGPTSLLEAGCGTGSSVVPILRGNRNIIVYGVDCSPAALARATELVSNDVDLKESQLRSFHPILCDVSEEALPMWLCCSSCRMAFKQNEHENGHRTAVACPEESCVGGVGIATLIFTLSSLPLDDMHHALAEIVAVLQPGGLLLFRDYGLYDMTMLRFPSSQRVSSRLYRRKDGTLSYFFSIEVVRELFTNLGLVEEELHYCCVQLLNRRKDISMKRVWIHAKFRKPSLVC